MCIRDSPGDALQLNIPEIEPADPIAQDIPLDIVFEDDQLIVLNKPAGMVVHPAAGNPDGTLVNALLFHCGDALTGIGGVHRPGIVHRLDKDTSGLMVVAKTQAAHDGLMAQFADRRIARRYLALVAGLPKPSSGTIDAPIGRSRHDRKKMAVLVNSGRAATTHYKTRAAFGLWASEVECQLETGRTHQIRVHMAHAGCPVIGDPVYGRVSRHMGKAPAQVKAACSAFERQALHAYNLRFEHPVSGEELSFNADAPSDYAQLRHVMDEAD